jgi:hypothetical protein
MSLARYEQLSGLVVDLLERLGVMDTSPIDPDEATAKDIIDRMGGVEGYSMDFHATTYILLPDDVQEILLLMASTIYSDTSYDNDDYSLDGEEE